MTYMRRTWLNIASQVSVHNCPVRTNNIAESFHNIACQKLGKQNINIWAFLEKVKDLLIDQELDLSRLQNGIASRRRRTNANINHRKEITSAQEEYNAGRLSLEEFLNMFTHNEKTFQINKVITLANEDSNDEIEDINYFDISYGPVEKERVHKKDRRTLPNTALTSSGSLKTKDTKVTENYLNEPQQCILHSSIVNIQSAQNLHDKFDSNHIDDDDIYEILEDRFWYDKTENQVSNDNNNRKEDIREHKEGYCIICFVKKATQVCVPCVFRQIYFSIFILRIRQKDRDLVNVELTVDLVNSLYLIFIQHQCTFVSDYHFPVKYSYLLVDPYVLVSTFIQSTPLTFKFNRFSFIQFFQFPFTLSFSDPKM
ncbi:uncharacterized protein LOC143360286 isoform X2 [Halictus rubicundus]|uniref:uncharacterized protein LOC143360286 isoform X2 n=1 Tax=Halictus rubicundus TaxID=77578 RepID=UPI004035ACD5